MKKEHPRSGMLHPMHASDPFAKFQTESLVLMRASTYLLKIHLAVIDGNHPLSSIHDELTETLGSSYEDPHQYFMSRLFIGHVAAFEVFLQDLLSIVISRHPLKLGGAQFKLAEILEAGSNDVLVSRAIAEATNKLMYKKPIDYRDAIAELLSISSSAIEHHWKVLIEAKARRDLGVHADWFCNEIYIRKLEEGGMVSTFSIGQSTVPQTGDYLQDVIDGLDSLARLLTNHVLEKFQTSKVPSPLAGEG
jgi:hypothetical protein